MENKYDNGKIYKIRNEITDDIYVGSTCNLLCKRMVQHRAYHANQKYRNIRLYKLMNEIGVEEFHIELIELFPCSSKDELRAREGHFIRSMGNLNHKIGGRTQQEYYADNKDKLAIKQKEYYMEHVNAIKKYNVEYRCINKDSINERRGAELECLCSGSYSLRDKAKHFKTMKHLKYE